MNIKDRILNIKNKLANKFSKKTDTVVEYDGCVDDFYDSEFGRDFIWGVKSVSDYNHDYACLHSKNDIEIVYDKASETYYLDILTDRAFERDKKDECKFLKRVLDDFTDYMHDHDYDTNQKLQFAFNYLNTVMDFSADNIPELYTKFRIFVAGFIAVYG